VGYTRGELINTISLAPGETLTLEVHSWDKSSTKTEQELSQESELRSAEKLTQRDALTVVQEFARQQTTKIDASLKIPLTKLSIGLEAGFEDKVSRQTKDTREQIREGVFEASHVLKATRKMRIDVSRETGREDKQTRTIQNTNRCHTLNCHYFEVMTNYIVATNLISLVPCVLLPNPRIQVTLEWVLCNEDVLRAALLDQLFLPGFDAARTLRAAEIAAESKRKASGPANMPTPDLDTNRAVQLLDRILETARQILSAVDVLNAGVDGWIRQFPTPHRDDAAINVLPILYDNGWNLGWLIYRGGLTGRTLNALKTLDAAKQNQLPNDALRAFLSTTTPNDYQPVVVPTLIDQGLKDQGLYPEVADRLLNQQLLARPFDDNGLITAVQAAASAFTSPSSGSTSPTSATFSGSSDPAAAAATAEEEQALANAQEAFEQLKCHIEHHLMHYSHAVWLREDEDERFQRLATNGNILPIIRNEILGFVGEKAAYPLVDVEAVKQWINFPKLIKTVTDNPAPTAEPQLITIPTRGTVLEALIGECDGCEQYIRESRVIDLKLRNAKAAQEAEEGRRRKLRLDAQPPDLSDPINVKGGRVIVNVGAEGNGENE
jgi:hypothetical protein